MSLYWPFFIADYYALLEQIAVVVMVLIVISSLDDLFIDAWYWIRQIYRRFTVQRKYRRLTTRQLTEKTEQPMAIMVPAWLEYDVIAAMIENMVSTLTYRNYVLFVGTYVNDTATIDEVERMRRRYPHLHRVEVPHDGPTCKADCLNWVIQAIFLHEKEKHTTFAGVVLHDSEDVLHPLEMHLFNYLLPRKDMIQLPVASLEREWFELVAGTYMDEFAEWHAKDLVVRENLTGMVPSAGVGTCFSRRALLALAAETHNQPFNTDSLTEDYDVGTRLARMGMSSIFVRFPVKFITRRKTWLGSRKSRELNYEMPLCVREFFPDRFYTAYRQKARWTLGIGLQSWAQLGWSGSLATKYLLFRDRKGIVTSFVSILAYLLLVQFVVFYIAALSGIWTVYYPPRLLNEGWTYYMAQATLYSLLLRVVQRMYFVNRIYGWEHAILSVPRMVIGNVINFMAASRAWKLFISSLITGKRLVWDKTMHDFPSDDKLIHERRRLGDILTSWHAIHQHDLDTAMTQHTVTQMPLGQILVSHGWLDEETLAEAISFQAELDRAQLTSAIVQAHAAELPIDICIRLSIVPLGLNSEQYPVVAASHVLSATALAELTTAFGVEPVQRIARDSEIAAALRLIAGGNDTFNRIASGARAIPLLGDLLIEQGLIKREVFEAAMQGYRPNQHGRIGDYLVQSGVIERASIERGIQLQHDFSKPEPEAA